MNIGFIGIGSMGAAMVPNLIKAGHAVSVWNRSAKPVEQLAGAAVLKSPASAFENEVVMTMLADDSAVRSVILESGALHQARKHCIHIMMATISPAFVDELVAHHRAAGVGYVAAPVFGVPAAAAQAQLNIVVAGDPGQVERVQPLFDVLGQKTWRLGEDPKRANVAKIAGNMMITLAIEAMGEASALSESYGVSAKDFLEIMTNTLFASPSYKRYGGFIAAGDYQAGFKLTLGLKDVNLARDAARARERTLPSLEIVRDHMLEAVAEGWGDKDWSITARMARRRAGVPNASA
jgi:3-hydroxyisobutyrate dehydrogenase-like beta-hydroxyacid dehydrogenase